MPDCILSQKMVIPGDGNCFFHSVIRILQLIISPKTIRKKLLDSVYLHNCTDPASAQTILHSHIEYADYNCLYIFSREYNLNICVHFHYFNSNTNMEEVVFYHYKRHTKLYSSSTCKPTLYTIHHKPNE